MSTFQIIRKLIAAGLATALFCCLPAAGQNAGQVRGTVSDIGGQPLAGVAVKEAGSANNYTLTDANGKYTIKVKDPSSASLEFSMLGMLGQTVKVKGKNTISVTLEEDSYNIDGVVVTGYQTTNKRELTSAITTVKAADVMMAGTMNVDQMLQGQIAGVAVTETSGSPGAASKIRVRGTSTIIGNKSPLWVLDGVILQDPVEIDHSDLTGDDAEYMVGNAIAGVNPSDIESISVLKDASATAIYGIQAANGVIVVTTRQGKEGKPRISYSGTVSVKQRDSYDQMDLMDAYDRIVLSSEIVDAGLHYTRNMSSLNLGYEGLLNQYESKGLTAEEFRSKVEQMAYRNTDWLGLLYRNAVTNSHTVSISGGTDRTTYYTSIGADIQPGTARGEQSNRYTVLAKLNSWLTKKLFIGVQLNASMRKNTGYYGINPRSYAYSTSRTIPCYNEDGSLFYYEPYSALGSGKDALTFNFLSEAENSGTESKVNNVTAKLNLQWLIWGGIKYELQGSYTTTQTVKNSWANDQTLQVAKIRGYSKDYYVETGSDEWQDSPLPVGGILDYSQTTASTWDLRNQLSYNGSFGDHVVSVMALNELRSSKNDGYSQYSYGYLPDRGKTVSPAYTDRYLLQLQGGSFNPTVTDNIRNVVSIRGVTSYSYKDRYLLSGSISMDGSNQFGTNPKYRFLPIWSVSGKWTVSEEDFLKNNVYLNYLALRASYGIQGNVDSGTSPDLVIKIGDISSETGLAESTVSYWPNADLRWEKTTSYNLGLDFSLLGTRINGTVDLYKKVGTDMIMTKTISAVNGITSYKINAGNMNNSGVEVALTGYPVKTRDWSMNIQVNYGYNRNEMTKANDELGTITTSEKLSGSALIVGEAIGTFYSYDFAGLDHDTGLPLYYDKDGNTKTVIDGKTYKNYTLYESELRLVKTGLLTPPHTGGVNIGLRFRNWHLNSSFTYSLGGMGRLPSIYNGNYSKIFDPEYNVTVDIKNRWKQPGDEEKTNIPALMDDYSYDGLRLRPTDSSKGDIYKGSAMYDYSTARVCSTDNFRLRSVSLSYNFPSALLKKMKINSLSIRLQATNLFIIADKKWHGYDPELGTSATSPIPRSYTLGVNITL